MNNHFTVVSRIHGLCFQEVSVCKEVGELLNRYIVCLYGIVLILCSHTWLCEW